MLDAVKFDITAKDRTASSFASLKRELGGVRGALVSVNDKAMRAGRSMRNIGAGMSVALTAPIAMLAKASVELYDTQAKAEAAVDQVIKSTGGAAQRSLQDLKSLASGLQDVTTFGDEGILRDVTAPLLTFKKIQGDVFDRAQANVLDMATMLKMDLKSASILVGKALNDPIKGLSALGRSGVTFTDSQKAVIESLVETGRVASAQGLILEELESQFQGQAAAAANTPMGHWTQLSNAIGDVKEELGREVVPFLVPLSKKVEAAVDWFGSLSPQIKSNIVVFGGLAAAIGPVVATLGLATIGVSGLATAFGALSTAIALNPIGAVVIALGGLAIALNAANRKYREAAAGGFVHMQANDEVTRSLGDEIRQSNLLGQAMQAGTAMSVDAAQKKLEEARARLKNVQAIYEEQRALGLAEAGRVGVGAASVTSPRAAAIDAQTRLGKAVGPTGQPMPDGSDYFDPRAQAAYEGRVTKSGIVAPIFNDEHREAVDGIRKNIAELEKGIANAEDGVVTFGNAIVAIEPGSRRSLEEIDTGLGKVGGSAAKAKDKTSELAKSLEFSKGVASSIKGTFDGLFDAIVEGGDRAGLAIEGLGKKLVAMTLQRSVYGLLASLLPGTFGKGGFMDLTANANGNVFSGGRIQAFATGGIVSSPTLFPMQGGAGLMGEAGPEAIMPLTRVNGRLGVRASGGGGGGGSQVVVQIVDQVGVGVRQESDTNSDGQQVERFVLERTKQEMARGGFDGPMGRFKVKPGTIKR
ncbi:hypothetical protein [Shimia aestuarii]|uniref:hypothetical protein n=1 Tax=Shimia aestuarii TaxID=254406 RepID=UPI003D7382A9